MTEKGRFLVPSKSSTQHLTKEFLCKVVGRQEVGRGGWGGTRTGVAGAARGGGGGGGGARSGRRPQSPPHSATSNKCGLAAGLVLPRSLCSGSFRRLPRPKPVLWGSFHKPWRRYGGAEPNPGLIL